MRSTLALVPPAPATLRRVISRPRLERLVDDLRDGDVLLAQAPAGYGKSTLLAAWTARLAARGARVRSVAPGETAAFAALDPDRPLTMLVDLETDDVSSLPATLRDALDRPIPGLRLIVATRTTPDLPLSRLRATGRLIELDAAALAFRPTEARLLLGKGGEDLCRTVEGWVAGLVLAQDFQATGRHRSIRDFLVDDVLRAAPAPLRDFVLHTAILDSLDPALCDVLTRGGSIERLEQARAAGLFVAPCDPEGTVWRYHPLFREAAAEAFARTDPDLKQALHRRAAEWLGDKGDRADAIRQASASGSIAFLAMTLERHAEAMTYDGSIRLVAAQAESLPRDLLDAHPGLLLTLAWLDIRRLDFARARQRLDTVARHLATPGGDAPERLRLLLDHREAMLVAARDDAHASAVVCPGLLDRLDRDDTYLRCTLLAQMMVAQRELMRFDQFGPTEVTANALIARGNLDFGSISLRAALGPSLHAAGRGDEAETVLAHALEVANSFLGAGSALAALPALPLALVRYERGDLAGAATLLAAHRDVTREYGFTDQLATAAVVEIRLASSAGDLQAAMRHVALAAALAHERRLDRMRAIVVAEGVRLLLQAGKPDRALDLLAAHGFDGDPADHLPCPGALGRHEIAASAHARVAIFRGDAAAGARLIAAWRSLCVRRGALRAALRWQLLAVQQAVFEGEQNGAIRAVREAVRLAASGGLIQPILDEGPAVTHLLTDAYPDIAGEEDAVAALVGRLFAALGRPVSSSGDQQHLGIAGRLVTREIEILGLVETGLRNREIGQRLGLTEGTVKWYMNQIYDKFGVRRRPHAVARARSLGLIH